jgi:hypothetical protein
MSPVHTYGMVTDPSVIQNQGMEVELEAVIVIENAREGVCHITCLAILLLDGILTTSNFRLQDPCMLSATHADAAPVSSLAQLSTALTTSGIQTAGRLHNIVASPVRALDPRIALDLFLEITKILISDTQKATSLHQRNATRMTISNPRNPLVAVVLQLTKTHLMHRLANLVSVHHLVPLLLLCLRHRLHVSHLKSLQTGPVGSLRFLDRHL